MSIERARLGRLVAQSVKRPTSAQVTISLLVGSSPTSGSVLTARSPEPTSDSVSVSLPLPCSHSASLSLSLSNINKTLKKNQIKLEERAWTVVMQVVPKPRWTVVHSTRRVCWRELRTDAQHRPRERISKLLAHAVPAARPSYPLPTCCFWRKQLEEARQKLLFPPHKEPGHFCSISLESP